MQANEVFDDLSQKFNEKIESHKNLCIETILTGQPSDYLMKDIKNGYSDLGRTVYTSMIMELREYISKETNNGNSR